MALAMTTDSHQPFLDAFGAPPPLLDAVRAQGRDRFLASGFPTRRDEAWRFTDLKRLSGTRFAAASALADTATLEGWLAARRASRPVDQLVFVNGRFSSAHSDIGALPDGVFLGSFADWAAAHPAEAAALFDLEGGVDRAFLSLNAACFTDGLALVVPTGVQLDRPIHAVYWGQSAEPAAVHVKSLLRLGRAAGATIVETYAGEGPVWTNVAVDADVAELARLGHYTLQDAPADGFHTAHLAARIGKGSHYDGFLLTLGAGFARQDMAGRIAGSHGFCGYSGAYLLHGRQDSAVASEIVHAAPNGQTREVFKGCVADRAHGVFQGKIRVEPDAQKTNAYQLNKTMLLGERASMDAKPELEIHADDVKCSHGATVGDLDETALFYLCSRGIPPEAARHMLIEAFVVDAVELVEDERVRGYLIGAIAHRLAIREGRVS